MSADSPTFDLNDPQTRSLARVIIATVVAHGAAPAGIDPIDALPSAEQHAHFAVSVADNILHRLSQPEAPAKAE